MPFCAIGVFRWFDVEAFHLAPKRRGMHSDLSGRRGPVPLVLSQGLIDHAPLHFLPRDAFALS